MKAELHLLKNNIQMQLDSIQELKSSILNEIFMGQYVNEEV